MKLFCSICQNTLNIELIMMLDTEISNNVRDAILLIDVDV